MRGRILHYSRSSRRVIQIGIMLIIASMLVRGVAAWVLRGEAEQAALVHTRNVSALVAEQTADSLQAVDLVLQDMQRKIQALGITTPEAFDQALGTPAFHDMLTRRIALLPQADTLSVVDGRGWIINGSRTWPVPPRDLSDRDYYAYGKSHTDGSAFVSEPVLNSARMPMIFLARRVNAPDGRFLGLLLGSMRLGYFTDIYTGLGLSRSTGITLLRRDGLVLVQFPGGRPAEVARMPTASPWQGLVDAGGGSYLSPDYLGGDSRYVAVHPVRGYPVVVDATISQDDALATWRSHVTMITVGTVLLMLCIIIMIRAIVGLVRRLEIERGAVVRRNEELMLAHARLERQAQSLLETTSALHESESRMMEKSGLLETTLEHMDQGLMMVDADGKVAVCNHTAMAMLDLPGEMMRAHPSFTQVLAYQGCTDELADAGAADPPVTPDMPLRCEHRANGRMLEVRGRPIEGGGFVRTYTDITERKEAEERIRYLAHHDGLTRLSNRVVFREHLEAALAGRRRGDSWAVFFLDLDNFKSVNDTLGHPVGDLLLCAVAERLRGSIRDDDLVARLGGDEFAIIQAGVASPEDAGVLARRVIDLLGEPFDLDGQQVTVGTSIGIAFGPADGATADVLIKNADLALYRAKAEGRCMYRCFEPAMDAEMQARRALEIDLRAALSKGEFELFFQPMLDAQSTALTGFEALIRWRHPERGLVGPADFVPVAEEIGLIGAIGAWVMQDACRQAAPWPDHLRIAVNLSPMQFRSGEIVDVVRAALEAAHLRSGRLELEITESVLLQNSGATINNLHRLRDLGVRISLDDFGTGYSSLSYLRSFPFDSIKIDQSFIRDLTSKADSLAIVRTVLDLGRTLGMSVTAEGVETPAQLAILQAQGCNEVQGHLFSKPCPGPELPALIKRLRSRVMEAA